MKSILPRSRTNVLSTLPIGVYCHVPFCASTCDFCAFYHEKPRRGDLNRYLDAMDLEFSRLPMGREVGTIFWGGGTPGLLSAKDLERMGRSLLERLPNAPQEWTVEMAPSTVKADKLVVLRDLGVTRISMGVQSFDAKLLESLGRLHKPKQIYKEWDLIQDAAFSNTNLDLIFAIPNQSIQGWESDLREAAKLRPNHISTYCLTFEEDTALYVKLSEGKVSIDSDRELYFYERGWELLSELGFEQYEVSNFSSNRSGQCQHNLNTWRMHEWIGCGPSAASQYGGFRYQRAANLDQWIEDLSNKDEEGSRIEQTMLDDRILFFDAVIFGLRMNKGIEWRQLQRRFPGAGSLLKLQKLLQKYVNEGLVIQEGTLFRLSPKGRLLADGIGSACLELISK
ncbi:MAG: radical SAM family heme chaperone HemW [Verrucomicrobiota bacterium]|nr:radical SAM family heme chaperone HemW [Verrucomicrobiota bacterium]